METILLKLVELETPKIVLGPQVVPPFADLRTILLLPTAHNVPEEVVVREKIFLLVPVVAAAQLVPLLLVTSIVPSPPTTKPKDEVGNNTSLNS